MPRSRSNKLTPAEAELVAAAKGEPPLRVYSFREHRLDREGLSRLRLAEDLCQRGLLRFCAKRGDPRDPWGDVWHEYVLPGQQPPPSRRVRSVTGDWSL
jgi:hypothetical protein